MDMIKEFCKMILRVNSFYAIGLFIFILHETIQYECVLGTFCDVIVPYLGIIGVKIAKIPSFGGFISDGDMKLCI